MKLSGQIPRSDFQFLPSYTNHSIASHQLWIRLNHSHCVGWSICLLALYTRIIYEWLGNIQRQYCHSVYQYIHAIHEKCLLQHESNFICHGLHFSIVTIIVITFEEIKALQSYILLQIVSILCKSMYQLHIYNLIAKIKKNFNCINNQSSMFMFISFSIAIDIFYGNSENQWQTILFRAAKHEYNAFFPPFKSYIWSFTVEIV